MELIKSLGIRKNKTGNNKTSWGLFLCSHYEQMGISVKGLSKQYDINCSMITDAVRYRTWIK